MIRPPPRAVTRFFIPLIDVLILLFCIFLLMPFVSGVPEAKTYTELPENLEQLQRELKVANRRIAELKNERTGLFEHFRIRVLEIDGRSGKLFAFPDAASGRQEVRNAADASRLIDRERSRAGAAELGFLILYPRELTGFPLRDQVENYRRWFRDLPLTFDNPWDTRQTGR